MKRKVFALLFAVSALCVLSACGGKENERKQDSPLAEEALTQEKDASEDELKTDEQDPTTLIYGSGDYTRINPALDEHGEINLLIFDGLTAHNGKNEVVPALAKSWDYDADTYTYTFYLEEGVKWHDGEPFTAEDVKFTIEAIMDPDNGSENAPNFEDVEEIRVVDAHTVSFRLAAPNAAFTDYMRMGSAPEAPSGRRGHADQRFFPEARRYRAVYAHELGRGCGDHTREK